MHSTKPLDRSWYDKSPKEVVQKLAGLQAQMRLKRGDHLIVLDNTETMAKNDADTCGLGPSMAASTRGSPSRSARPVPRLPYPADCFAAPTTVDAAQALSAALRSRFGVLPVDVGFRRRKSFY